jgi:hypothetical protein
MSGVTAADLHRMTTPFRPQSEREKIESMSADEFYRSEHRKTLREERNRKADQAIQGQQAQEIDKAVNLFLQSHRDYARVDSNREKLLAWIADRGYQVTTNSLHDAYVALKSKGELALTTEHEATHGVTRVVDYFDLAKTQHLPAMPQPIEIVERTKCITIQDLRKMSAEEYAEALRNPTLAPQIETLLKEE